MNVRHVAAALAMTLATGAQERSLAEMQARGRWQNAWNCPAFKTVYYQPAVPLVKNPRDARLVGVPAGLDAKLADKTPMNFAIAYDAEHRIAYTFDAMDVPMVLRPTAPPRFAVVRADLSGIRLKSGITIGTRASKVIAVFGKPSAQRGCGDELYTYALGPMHYSLLLTLHRGLVVRIDYWEDD